MSPKSTSAISPRVTTWEKPKPRPQAQSSAAVVTAPDWATSARPPGAGVSWAKLALMPLGGDRNPRQLGPMIRSR